MQLPILDSPKFDILAHLPRAVDFVDDALSGGGRVLVHCQAGISRSATVVAAYLIASRGVSPQTALEIIRKARPCIQPNFGFIKQLDVWHESKCIVSVEHKPTRLHFIEKTVRSVKAGRGVHIYKDMLAAAAVRPSAGAAGGGGSRIRCKMCRRELASREHMFPHGAPAPEQEVEVEVEARVQVVSPADAVSSIPISTATATTAATIGGEAVETARANGETPAPSIGRAGTAGNRRIRAAPSWGPSPSPRREHNASGNIGRQAGNSQRTADTRGVLRIFRRAVGMDASVSGRGQSGGQDCVPERKVRCEARLVCVGGREMRVWRVGDAGILHPSI